MSEGIPPPCRKRSEHRKIKLGDRTPGMCRFCGESIRDPKTNAVLTRKTWHPDCVKRYKEQAHPSELRRAIYRRDKGICAGCGQNCNDWKHWWQADHIVPLAAGGSFEHSNVQTLCTACHKTKSKADLITIAAYRKGGGIPK